MAPDRQDPDTDKDTTLSLIAKGLPGTLLKRLPASTMSEVDPAELAEQTDTWLSAMTDTLSRFVGHLPRPTALAEPGLTQDLAPCTLSVRRGVVWLSRPPSGASLFMDVVDETELAEAGGATRSGDTVDAVELAHPVRRGDPFRHIDRNAGPRRHFAARDGFLSRRRLHPGRLNRRLAVVDDANLERARTASRRTAEEAARRRLFNIYDLPVDRDASEEDTSLADALAIIGRREGIDFRIPARSGPSDSAVGLVDILDASGVRARRVRFKAEGNWWRGDSNAMLGFRAEDGQAVALLPGAFGRYWEIDRSPSAVSGLLRTAPVRSRRKPGCSTGRCRRRTRSLPIC